MNVTTRINIDLCKPDMALQVNAVQGDIGSRSLELSFYEGISPWEIPDGTKAAVRYCKPDNTKGYYDALPDGTSAWQYTDNKLIVALAPQMLTVPGTVQAQVELLCDQKILSTFCLSVYVEKNPAAGVLRSEDYVNWLQWIQAQSQAHAQTVQQAAFQAQEVSRTVTVAAQAAGDAARTAETAAAAAQSAREETADISRGVSAIVAGNEAYTKQEGDLRYATAIVQHASGETIRLSDSAAAPLQGLALFGKTTQNGIPTPAAPIPMVNAGENGTVTITFDGNSQTLPVLTPNGLSGFPVSAGGNYTDSTGQQWFCDEVDFGRGVYVQRMRRRELTGNEGFVVGSDGISYYVDYYKNDTPEAYPAAGILPGLCSHYQYIPSTNRTDGFHYYHLGYGPYLYRHMFTDESVSNVSAFRSKLQALYAAGTPVVTFDCLATPVESPLTEEALSAYRALHLYAPETTVTSDSGVGIAVAYTADTKRYLEAKLAQLSAPLTI